MKKIITFIAFVTIVTNCMGQHLTWDNKLQLPDSLGVAGTFGGVTAGYLIVAGGANFPSGVPWEGGKKTWHSTIYYKNITDSSTKWITSKEPLPSPIAYGISIETKYGLLCIGGCNADRCTDQVLLINIINEKIEITDSFPKLPKPLANAAGAIINDKIYIAGGNETMTDERASSHFFMLDLSNINGGWQNLKSWDGPPRGFAVGAGQNGKFYLFSGRNYSKEQGITILFDGHVYDPKNGTWEKLDNNFPIMAGGSLSFDKDKIVLLGGTDKIIAGSDKHPGFGNTIRIYNTTTNTLKQIEAPYKIAVTTSVARHDNTFYICSGETKPGIRTPTILKGTIK